MANFRFEELSTVGKMIITQSTVEEVDQIIANGKKNESHGMEIQLFVNGVDISHNYEKLADAIDRQFNNAVEKRAVEIVQERYSELISRLQQASDALELGDPEE